jgi:hypothetical protein
MSAMACIDGALLGLIDTAFFAATISNCGTNAFSATASSSQPRMIGTARRRIHCATNRGFRSSARSREDDITSPC